MKNPKHVADKLFRSGMPECLADIGRLYDRQEIKTIICLQEGWTSALGGWKGEAEACAGLGIEYLHFPMSNFLPPVVEELEVIYQHIKQASNRGNVLVHCRAGVDRTGFVCAYVQVRDHLLSPEEAMREAFSMGMHWWYRIGWRDAFRNVLRSAWLK